MTLPTQPQNEGIPLRLENRECVVHLVEYSHYPRRLANEKRLTAYTQDRSESGLGLDLPNRVRPGELLRVTLQDIDGHVDVDGLARVVWCKETAGGRARAGLAMVRQDGRRKLMRVRGRSVISPTPTLGREVPGSA